MKKKLGFILIAIFSLLLTTHCFATEWTGSFEEASILYTQARGLFEDGEEAYAESLALFERIPLYQDSVKYICYIHSMQALDANDLESAYAGFLMLQKARFLDSDTLFSYVCARRAEHVGDYHQALSLYSGLYAFDSRERLESLNKTVYGATSTGDEAPPLRAKKGAYAMAIAREARVFNSPGDCEPFARLPFATYVRADSFAYDVSGRLYVEITIEARSSFALSPHAESKKGYVLAHFLYFLTELEMADSGFPLANPLIRGDITWTGEVTQANAPVYDTVKKGKIVQTVHSGDTLVINDQIFADKVFYQVILPNETYGYIESGFVAETLTPNVVTPSPSQEAFRLAHSPIPPAPNTEQYLFDHALGLLLSGSAEAYQSAVLLFSRAESEYSAFYMLYANVLLQIEKEDFNEARQALSTFENTNYFQRRKANTERGILSNEPLEIPEPDLLIDYINAREYESQRLYDLAHDQYSELGSFLDALLRGARVATMRKEKTVDPFADETRQKNSVEEAIKSQPLSPLTVNILSNDLEDPDQKQMYAYRESVMKKAQDESHDRLSLSSAEDVASDWLESIETVIIKRFVPKLYDAFQSNSIFSPNASYFEDIAIQKIISIDISPNEKRWNVCALLKMVKPRTGETVYLPIQMSDSGQLSSPYFTDVANSIEAFASAYPLLLPKDSHAE